MYYGYLEWLIAFEVLLTRDASFSMRLANLQT